MMKTAIIRVIESGSGARAKVLGYGIVASCSSGMRGAAELAAIKFKYFPATVACYSKRFEEEGITLKETARSLSLATYHVESP